MVEKYPEIFQHYEACFEKHGDVPQGLDWPNLPDLLTRYQMMLDVIKEKDKPVSLLDFGCGTAGLYSYLTERHLPIAYTGIDASQKFITYCQQKLPCVPFQCADILRTPELVGEFDYVIANGVFTVKRSLSFAEMLDFWSRTITVLFAKAKQGIAFNCMSKQVLWERDDLFHLPLDTMASFVCHKLSRNFVVRNDYGLYEYTAYVYR